MTVQGGLDIQVTQPALLFDLDGTLVDSVYQHVIAWQEALALFSSCAARCLALRSPWSGSAWPKALTSLASTQSLSLSGRCSATFLRLCRVHLG